MFQTIQFLRDQGYSISLLLYPFDEEWVSTIPPYYADLVAQFEYFAVIPNRRALHRPAVGFHHTIDEWWDDSIAEHLSWLFKRRRFDVLFVNYTFFSKAFEFAPAGVVRILDTHDLFTGRREMFERYRVPAEFFYTNANEEKIAFDRADLVLAIKASEAEFIRTLTTSHVTNLPYWVDGPKPTQGSVATSKKQRKFNHDYPFRVGFIGAFNSVNAVNMRRFLHVFDRYVRFYNLPVEIVVAGNVCRELGTDYSFLTKLGRVANIREFYEKIDAVIAPLEFSTGIKIKIGEALAWGLPVLSTANGFDGFQPFSSTQVEPSIASLCQTLASISTNELAYADLAMAARHAAQAASRAQKEGFIEIRKWIKNNVRRIFVITDRPFWRRNTFFDELTAHAIEYVSHIAHTIVVVRSDEAIESASVYADAEYWHARDEDDLAMIFRDSSRNCRIDGAIFFVDVKRLEAVKTMVTEFNFDTWVVGLTPQGPNSMIRFSRWRDSQEAVVVTPLRYPTLKSGIVLDPRQVAIFHPEKLSEWDQCVIEYISELCSSRDLTVQHIPIPVEAQYDQTFFDRSVKVAAARIVMLDCEGFGALFAQQIASYRNAQCFMVGPGLLCPQIGNSVDSFPSLIDSIDAFLSRDGSANATAGANTGWAALWHALANSAGDG